jgi:nitrate/nitrite-specific signal transduction histidine kinase
VSGNHLGLGIMAERAAAIGAQWRITSCLGGGTRVDIYWPAPGQSREGS